MSQEKVNKYKQEKARRQEMMKKERRKQKASMIAVFGVIAALAVWFCVSVVMHQIYNEVTYYYTDYTAIENYITNLEAS